MEEMGRDIWRRTTEGARARCGLSSHWRRRRRRRLKEIAKTLIAIPAAYLNCLI
jgi:hypothetical protein